MIFEFCKDDIKPGKMVEFMNRFRDQLAYQEKYKKLGAFWYTEIGPLGEVVYVWLYESTQQRDEVREAAKKDPHLQELSAIDELVKSRDMEVLLPAPFMQPWGSRDIGAGNVYEMRIYTYQPGSMPKVLERWAEALPNRERYSPLVACWHSLEGGSNRLVYIWVFEDLNEKVRITAASTKDHWPPKTDEWAVSWENRILIGKEFSPLK